jgi:hypothetical protein
VLITSCSFYYRKTAKCNIRVVEKTIEYDSIKLTIKTVFADDSITNGNGTEPTYDLEPIVLNQRMYFYVKNKLVFEENFPAYKKKMITNNGRPFVVSLSIIYWVEIYKGEKGLVYHVVTYPGMATNRMHFNLYYSPYGRIDDYSYENYYFDSRPDPKIKTNHKRTMEFIFEKYGLRYTLREDSVLFFKPADHKVAFKDIYRD